MNVPTGKPERGWYLNPDVIAPVVLTLLGVLFFADPLFSSKNFYFRDILNFHYPLRRILIDSYARGEFPLWNPYVYFGQPMLANPNYMAFYPSNLFHLFLPFNYAFKLHFIIHPLLAGVGCYFLQRRLGILPLACFGGSVVYEFSGIVLSFLNLYNFVPSVALLPWIGWSFLTALQTRSGRRVLLFGFFLSLQILSLDLFIALGDVLLLAGLVVIHFLSEQRRFQALRAAFRVGLLGALLAVGLAAVQILPTLELIPRSVRGLGFGFESAMAWSLNPMDLPNVIIPNLFGNPYTLTKADYWGEAYHHGREGYLVSFFVGMGGCLLALLSFFSLRKKAQITFTLLAICGGFLALGTFNPIWNWLYRFLPVTHLGRYPSKFSLLTGLALSLLVALGIEVLVTIHKGEHRRSNPIWIVAGIGFALGTCFLVFAAYCGGHPRLLEEFVSARLLPALVPTKNMAAIAKQLAANLRWSGAFSVIISLIFLLSSFVKRTALIGVLAVFALCGEILSQNLRLVPLISDADVNFVSEVNAYLGRSGKGRMCRVLSPETQAQDRPNRIFAPNDSAAWASLFAQRAGLPIYGIMSGIQYSLYRSVDGLNTAESDTVFEAFNKMGVPEGLELLRRTNSCFIVTLDEIKNPALRLEVNYDTHSDLRLNVYSIANTLERVYFAPFAEAGDSASQALMHLLDPLFPVRDTVILERSRSQNREGPRGFGSVKLIEYTNQRVLCELDSQSPGFIMLLDSYYPGWVSRVDGKRMSILRANYVFRAVQVQAGKHRVEFDYKPVSFYLGLGITLLSLVAAAIILLVLPLGRHHSAARHR